MRTFLDLKTEVLRYFDVADEPAGSADVLLVEAALNQANQRRATEDDWTFMLSRPRDIALTAGTQELIIPYEDVHKLQYLYSVTNDRFVEVVNVRQAPYEGQFIATDPTVNCELIQDGSPVQAQPDYPDQLVVDSDETEASGVGLYLEGEDEDGLPLSEFVEAGETSVGVYARVSYYAKVGDWAGTLTLLTEADQTLVTLTTDQAAKSYLVVRFYNEPTAAETFSYRYFRRPRVMTRDYDRPDLPFPLANLLVYDALLDLATYNELDSESVNVWKEKQQEWELNLYTLKLEAAQVNGAPWMINTGRRG